MVLPRPCQGVFDFFIWLNEFISEVVLQPNVEWLMGYPAGLKINSELTQTLGSIALSIAVLWKSKCFCCLESQHVSC